MTIKIVSKEKQKFYPSLGKCIYCGATDKKLSDEHIIPYGLNGYLIFRESSCDGCAKITSKQERFVLKEMNLNTRISNKMQSRHSKYQDEIHKFVFIDPEGNEIIKEVTAKDMPNYVLGYKFPPPGILSGRFATNRIEGSLICISRDNDLRNIIPQNTKMKLGTICQLTFCQMLAKIAHSYAVAEFGMDAFVQRLPDYILEKKEDIARYVGGATINFLPKNKSFNAIHSFIEEYYYSVHYLIVAYQFFGMSNLPWYNIVVGEVKNNKLDAILRKMEKCDS